MINPTRVEIDKIFARIDKVAKKGTDNYLEYFILIDDLIKKEKYYYLIECLNSKYNYVGDGQNIPTLKKESWKQILFNTKTSFQDMQTKLLKSKGVYQQGLYYYKEIPLTSAKVIDSTGYGCELQTITQDGGVVSIKVLNPGFNYSASASVVITGGTGTASATPNIIAKKVYSVNITATGSGHNQSNKLGQIIEEDVYKVPNIEGKFTQDLYQKILGNKKTYLVAIKTNEFQGVSFSSWNEKWTYDKNISNLYNQAVNYLLG